MVTVVWGAILEVFGSIMTGMIKLFNEQYVVVSEAVFVAATTTVAATGFKGEVHYSNGTSAP